MQLFVFICAGLMILAGAVGVITRSHPVHAALSLVLTLFGVAVMYVSQEAEFLAAVQIIVYSGAIVVLFLFVIMLLNLQVEERASAAPPMVGVALVGGIALAGLVLFAIVRMPLGPPVPVHAGFGGTEALAERLFTVWLLPFELTSLLLLVAIVGAVVVGRKHSER